MRFILSWPISIVLIVIAWAVCTQAQETTSVAQMNSQEKEKKLTIQASLVTSSNLYKDDALDREAATELAMSPSYSLSSETLLAMSASLLKEETQGRNTAFSNTTVALRQKGPAFFNDGVSQFSLGAVAPTATDNSTTDRLRGALFVASSVQKKGVVWGFTYGASLQKNFHEYTLNADGSPNVEYSLAQSLGVSYTLSDLWSLSCGGVFKIGRSYRGFYRQAYGVNFGVNYTVDAKWSLGVGLSTEGNVLKANGTSSNIQAYDAKRSTVYASLTFVN